MKRKAGLHKRVSSIFEDLNVADQTGTAHQADAGADAGAALSVEHHDRQPPSAGRSLQPQSCQIEEPIAEPVAEEATKVRKVRVVRPRPGKPKVKATRRQIHVAAGVIILLLMTLAVMGGRTWFAAPAEPEGNTAGQASAFAENVAAIDWQMPRRLPEPIRDVMSYEHNLTISRPGQLQEIVVRGILYSDDQPSAIIGTQIVQVGNEIMGARIIGITRHAVEFEKEGRKWTQNVEMEDVP